MSSDGGPRHEVDGYPETTLIAQICDDCVRSLPMTGAAVSVMTFAGHQGTVYATDEVAALVEELHFGLGEGPGVSAFHGRQAVVVRDLAHSAAADHWPAFTAAALEAGVRAVAAFPLLIGAAELGVLVMYADGPVVLDGAHRHSALRLADAASLDLLDLLGGSGPDAVKEDAGSGDGSVDAAAFFRVEVYQAAGMAMVQLGVSIEEAMVRLRAYAFAHEQPVLDVARAIVRRELRLGTR